MNLEIVKVEDTKQEFKCIRIFDEHVTYVYSWYPGGKRKLSKANEKVNRNWEYRNEFPKSLKKLVEEMDFIMDSLVENDHIEVAIIH